MSQQPCTQKRETQTVPTEELQCEMCGKSIETKPGAGKLKKYCSSPCKQAAYRRSKGAQVENRKEGRPVGNDQVRHDGVAVCALEGCQKPAPPGKYKRWLMYCSNAHKQKAKRLRKQAAKETLPLLFYFRKGKGVIHLTVNRTVTFCGRDAGPMNEVKYDEGYQICQRCQRTRDEKTWWLGWREAFGEE